MNLIGWFINENAFLPLSYINLSVFAFYFSAIYYPCYEDG